MEQVQQNRKSREADSREVVYKRPTSWSAPETLPTPDRKSTRLNSSH